MGKRLGEDGLTDHWIEITDQSERRLMPGKARKARGKG